MKGVEKAEGARHGGGLQLACRSFFVAYFPIEFFFILSIRYCHPLLLCSLLVALNNAVVYTTSLRLCID